MSAGEHPTPGKSIRTYCLWCAGQSSAEARHCPAALCALWPWRFGQRPETRGLARGRSRTATRAIYLRCYNCHETQRDCKTPECPLYHINRQRFCARKSASTAASGRGVAHGKGQTGVQA